ncbi:MAG: metal ABC transporter ATP-binding protein [Erysipelotrichaceae bacterium]|nr:metal ABC transporter ATP-binding protein [Erysipelotrichaceae bacterium]
MLLEVNKLSFGYDRKEIVRNLSFTVEKGDYLCVIGENGAGKTTLIKVLLNLKKPYSGTINFSDGLTQHEIGYLPQHTSVQKDFPATVREIVLSGCLGRLGKKFFYDEEDRKLADESIRRMKIEALADRCYNELSGGQQQRVLLARCLCATRKLIILDEPSTSLDYETTCEMYQLIAQLNREGIAIIMISHDLDKALDQAKHILLLEDEDSFFGTRDEYLESRRKARVIGND